MNDNSQNRNYRASSSQSGFGSIMLIFIGLALLIGPMLLPNSIVSGLSVWVLSALGLVVLTIGAILYSLTKLYIKTPSNMAFVRTGMGGQKVIIDGGAVFIPLFHELMPVLTETMKIVVTRQGPSALITKDNLRADVQIEFYIKVEKNSTAVVAAATSLGHKGLDPDNIKSLIEEKLVSSLRSVSAKSDLLDLHGDKQKFADDVQALVKTDLQHNGLTLESVACSKLDQADYKGLDLDNIFNAQGAKTVAEKTNAALVSKNEIEKKAQVDIAKQNLDATQQTNELKVKEEQSIAEKAKSIEILQATNATEARKGKAELDRLAQEAEIESQEKIAVRTQEKEKAIETASVQKQQAIEVANITKAQTIDVQNQEKEKASEIARLTKEKAVLTETAERAKVETQKAEAEGKAAAANQAVLTITEVAKADREKQVTVKKQEAVAETTKINKNVETDIKAYEITKSAEAAKLAADNNAAATTTTADANFKAKEFEAKGELAVQMVPVNVSKAQVAVKAEQVEVTGKELKYKADYSQVSITLETNLANINAQKEVGQAFANALGVAFSKANLNIWGDGKTATDMMNQFSQGQGNYFKLKALTDGGSDRNPVREEAKELVKAYISGLKTANEVMGAADNVSAEVKSLVAEFVHSGGGNTFAGIGLMIKFLTGKDASKDDIKKLETLMADMQK